MLATLFSPCILGIEKHAPHGTGLEKRNGFDTGVSRGKATPRFVPFPFVFSLPGTARVPRLIMDLYLFCLGLSFCGLLVMAFAGLGHHAHSHGGHGSHGHSRSVPLKLHKAPAHGRGGQREQVGAGVMLLGLLSPRTFLSLLLGFGATGVILHPVLDGSPVLLFILATIGGWAFERLIIQPFWRFLFGFASDPARTLNTVVHEQSTAATDFDADGRGLISIELDGQVRQVLGRLCPEERAQADGRVRTGERLLIQAVDDRRNTCTVSRLRAC